MNSLRQQYGLLFWRTAWCLALIFTLSNQTLISQNDPEYEEISVFLMVQRVGGIEIPAIYHNQQIYLPVQDVFNFLKIKNTPSPTYDIITGFFINQETPYEINKQNNKITYIKKVYDLKPDDLISTSSNLYLKSNFFGEVFGLDCTFNFRSLSVTLNTKIELPVIRDMRLEFMRNNINRLKGEIVADTIIKRRNPFFGFGTADWSIIANQEINGEKQARYNLGLGGIVAGGEARVALQYYANQPFTEKQQQYLWRFVNNDRKALRQVMLGKIASQATSSIFNPVVGMQLTNAPTTYRRSFGTYTLSDYTEPDWAVELYVNNVLVDYVKADASGFFTFEVPMMYGSTVVLLRYYGPFGEERSKEQNITVPYNFLPAKEFQYTLSAGMVEDTLFSRFSRGNANYGINRFMTVGGGMEYLSSVTSGSFMPFVNTSLRIGSNLLFSGEYTYGVRGKGILNYRTAKNFQVELNYTRYDPNQTAISYNYLEERKAMISFPIRGPNFSAYSRISFSQNILPSTQYSTAEWLLSGVLMGVSTNFTTYAMIAERARPYVYSNLSLGLRLPGKFLFRPQAQFEYTGNQLVLVKADLEKQLLKHGFLNLSYEYNFKSSIQNIQVGFRYDFSVAQTSFSYRKSNDVSTFIESAHGSLLVDRKTKYTALTNRSSIGKGGIVILPFLDMNGNGKYDKGETKVLGLKININGGRVEQSKKDSVMRIFDLEPYVSYFIELDRFSFENIAWQIHLKNMRVDVEPNQFKLVELPISVMGEASGMVSKRAASDKGPGGIIVNFYKSDGVFCARVITESDGYFSFLGLLPGSYIARIDTAQMRKLNMTATPATLPFEIEKTVEGDVKDALDFLIRSNIVEEIPDDIKKPESVKAPEVLKKTELKEEVKSTITPLIDKKQDGTIIKSEIVKVFCVQLAASKTYIDPSDFKRKFKLTEDVLVFRRDGWFKYVIGQFATEQEAYSKLNQMGISGFVVSVDKTLLKDK